MTVQTQSSQTHENHGTQFSTQFNHNNKLFISVKKMKSQSL